MRLYILFAAVFGIIALMPLIEIALYPKDRGMLVVWALAALACAVACLLMGLR